MSVAAPLSTAATAAGATAARRGAAGPWRVLAALARADFLERTRRSSTLITLMAMLFMAWQAMPSNPRQFSMSVQLGDYRGVYNSAWVGGLLTMLVTTLLTLIGFYLVKNAVERDRLTGVGEILATTPLGKPAYTLGKTLSNFLFLAALPATLWVAGMGMQLLRGEERHLDPWIMAQPLLVISLPALALVSALAVLFECIRWLRGTLGNVVYFFLWTFSLVSGMTSRIDLLGISALQASMGAACQARYPDYNLKDLTIGGGVEPVRGTFVWDGLHLTGTVLAERLIALALALGVALVAAVVFDRFDPTRGFARAAGGPAPGKRPRSAPAGPPEPALDPLDPGAATLAAPAPRPGGAHITLTPLAQGARHFRLLPLVVAELKLMLKGVSRWWYLVMLGLFIAGLAAPAPGGAIVRGIAWIWPIALWAGLGVRASRHRTEELLLSSPGPRARQWPAALLAGMLVALLPGLGCLAHGAAAHGAAGLVTAAAGIVFVPAFAFATGRLTGSSRFFEIAFLLLWYVGPMNGVPLFDFSGGAPLLAGYGTAAGFVLAAVGALTLAALRPDRRR